MRRFATLALSLTFLLGSAAAGRLLAQDEKKVEVPKEAPKADPAQVIPKDAPPNADAPKDAVPAPTEPAKPATKPVPPEVQAKLDAARKAVAEAIVAAENAGLVDTSINDPPPILDILITGQAADTAALKAVTKDAPEAGVSPEVFGAWFTGFGKTMEGITAEKNVRIVPPSKGLSDWYRTRAAVMTPYLAEARKANPRPAATPPAEAPKADEPKKDAPPKEEMKKDEPKKDEPKPEAKKEETKKDEPKETPKPDEPKKDEPKPADEPKKDEPKPADVPKEEPKKDEPKG